MGLRLRRDCRQGILPFVLEQGRRDDVTARAGLPLVVETMRAMGLDEIAAKELPEPKRERGFAPEQKLEAIVTLIAAGGDRMEDIRVLSQDKGLEKLLGASFPSPDALLDFIGQFHDPKCFEDRPPDKKAWVPPESEALRALEVVNRELVARGADRSVTQATIDHDGTIIEAHKRDATVAYEGRHRQKAGTIEHVHRVIKDELGAGVLPSARFGANAAWFRINALTFNVLTVLKRRALPERFWDARPKRLRYELFTLAGELVVHQSQLSVRVPAADGRFQEIVDARGHLLAMYDARRSG